MYTVFIFFLWVCFAIIFLAVKKPIRKSYLKAFVVLACVFLTAHWWRINISVNDMLYQNACLVSKSKGRGLAYLFKHKDNIIVYQWSQPSKFYFKNEYLNKCFIVEYYKFLGDRYIYSATLIKGDE
jgi:hypothetical protein